MKKVLITDVTGQDGSYLVEFLHVDDLVSACVFLMNNLEASDLYGEGISHINAGSGDEVTIKELALTIKEIIGYKGELVFNGDYPDGMPRKLLGFTKITDLGWQAKINLKNSINLVYNCYLRNIVKA